MPSLLVVLSAVPNLPLTWSSLPYPQINDALATATAPVRNTQTYKVVAESVGEAFDDSNMLRYGGFAQKEVRRKRRQERLEKLGRLGMGVGSRVKANDE